MEANNKLREARKAFSGFDVVFRDIAGENPIQVLELKNPNGSINYYIRYVFDRKGGTITISGDLGEAVVCPTWPATLEATAAVGINPRYFMEKVRCSTDRYEYDEATFRERLEQWMRCNAEGNDDVDEDDVEYDIDAVMGAFDSREGFMGYDADAIQALNKYTSDWGEEVASWGREWDMRVYLWLAGLEYARNALAEKG